MKTKVEVRYGKHKGKEGYVDGYVLVAKCVKALVVSGIDIIEEDIENLIVKSKRK